MIFLLNFRQDILHGEIFAEERENLFIDFADLVKNHFDNEKAGPQAVIEEILRMKDILIKKLSTAEERIRF